MARRTAKANGAAPKLESGSYGITESIARHFAEKHAAGWAALAHQAWMEGEEWAGLYVTTLDTEVAYALSEGDRSAWRVTENAAEERASYSGVYAETFFWDAVVYNLSYGLQMAFRDLRRNHGMHALRKQRGGAMKPTKPPLPRVDSGDDDEGDYDDR